MKKLFLILICLLWMVPNSWAASVVIVWEAPTTLVGGLPIPAGEVITYNIYRGYRSDGSDLARINDLPILVTTFTDATVVTGRYYYYVCRAVRVLNGLESAKSNTAIANTVLTASPKNLITNVQP